MKHLLIITAVSIMVLGYRVNAQTSQKADTVDTCETTLAKLSGVASAFSSRKNLASLLIIIANPGRGESFKLNTRRLVTVKTYLKSRIPNAQSAIGTGHQRLGNLRFFIDGEFVEEIRFNLRSPVCLSSP